jgi:hypothetical protein
MWNMINNYSKYVIHRKKRAIPKTLGWIVLKLKTSSICYPFGVGEKLKHNDFYLGVT